MLLDPWPLLMTRNHQAEEARSKARARQQKRRRRLAVSGTPTTHAINRAVAEALLFCAEQNMKPGVPRSQTTLEFGAVIAHASLILIVGNGQSPTFEVSEVHRVMQERFKRRPRTWTIGP
jgi:hypothetical protein